MEMKKRLDGNYEKIRWKSGGNETWGRLWIKGWKFGRKESFFKYVTTSKYENARRACSMAFDILLPYKERTKRDITFDDLLDGKNFKGDVDRLQRAV